VQGFNNNADNYFEKYEPIRAYFETEIKKIGESDKTIANALGYKDSRTVNHWYAKSQWSYPTDENIKALTEYAKSKGLEILVGNEKIKKEYEQIKKEYEKIKKEWYETRAYFNNTHDNINNVWHFDRTSSEERELTGGHATPKPIALCARAIKSSSREGEIVLDLFGGSGSTLIACEQLKRACYVMELEPKYVDVIIKRWETLTGQKAELIKGGE
jgi:DNA modification methylase